MESKNIYHVQNENAEKDVKMQEVMKNEDAEIFVSEEANLSNEGSMQHQTAEEALTNSSTCVESDQVLVTQTEINAASNTPPSNAQEPLSKLYSMGQVENDIKVNVASNLSPLNTQEPLGQLESMDQATSVQSQETIEAIEPTRQEETITDDNTKCMANEVNVNVQITDSSAAAVIETEDSAEVLNSAASTPKEAAASKSIETIAVSAQEPDNVRETLNQEVQENNEIVSEYVAAKVVENDSLLNGAESITQNRTEDVTTSNDVPQIIENLILVKGFNEQPTMHHVDAADETHTIAAAQPELETPMETNDIAIHENISQILKLPNNTAPTAHSESSKTSITPAALSGLSMLAQYDSEDESEAEDSDDVSSKLPNNEIERISDTESVVEVPTTNHDYRSRVVEVDSDSDSETDSSDSDVASEVSYLAEIRKAIDKSMDVDADVDADAADEDEYDENGTRTKRQPPRVKGEFLIDDLPPIQDLHITVPEAECVELGKVHSIVDQLVLVNALPNSVLLDLETVLFLDKGQRVLGEVFDVLGQVADPLYCVRFNSNKQILEKNIKVGEQVYVAPKTQYTQFVILSSLMKMRGSDASWENDVEPPPRYLDYSDDEQERDARARLRNRDRSTDHWDPSKRSRSDLDFSSPSPSMSPSPSPSPFPRNPFHQMRPRGGRGGFRTPRYQHPPQEYHPRASYNTGSWHSNYPQPYAVPPQNFAAVPPPHVMYAQPPPTNFAAYPPQAVPMQPYPVAQPNLQHPPPQVYVLNPYTVRPPVLAHTSPQTPLYTTVLQPPPPPGNN